MKKIRMTVGQAIVKFLNQQYVEFDGVEEPFVDAQVITPQEYVGAIMELCQQRRGVYHGMEYIEENRALLKYELPLNEIIYDFFDAGLNDCLGAFVAREKCNVKFAAVHIGDAV